jgi:hypothetical protein
VVTRKGTFLPVWMPSVNVQVNAPLEDLQFGEASVVLKTFGLKAPSAIEIDFVLGEMKCACRPGRRAGIFSRNSSLARSRFAAAGWGAPGPAAEGRPLGAPAHEASANARAAHAMRVVTTWGFLERFGGTFGATLRHLRRLGVR